MDPGRGAVGIGAEHAHHALERVAGPPGDHHSGAPRTSHDQPDPNRPGNDQERAGRSLVLLGGAYLFRALTDAHVLPAGAGVALGLLYAAVLLPAWQYKGFTERGGGVTQASRYSISLTAKIVYRKIGQKEPIWSNDAFSQRDEYDMGDNASTYFDREEQTIERISEAFARSLVDAMLEAF